MPNCNFYKIKTLQRKFLKLPIQQNVIAIWKQLRSRYADVLKKDDDFWRRSFLSVLFQRFLERLRKISNIIQNKKEICKGGVYKT